MKEYRLADCLFRKTVSLKEYETDIIKAVHTVKPKATVTVTERGFTVEPPIRKLESIAVSKILRSGRMNKLTMYRPCLFNGYEINDKEENNEQTNKS